MSHCSRVAISLLLFLLPQAPAHAQTQQKLTLQEAMEHATRRNLDLAAARLRHAVSETGIQIARQRPNPSVIFGALRDSPHESLVVDQPIEIGGRRGRRIGLARQEVALTDAELAALDRQIRRAVRDAYYQVALTQAVALQQGRVLDLAKRLREIAQARFEAGDVPELEVFQADLEAARAESDLAVAQQQERIAASQLNVLLNEPAEASWEIASPLESLPTPPGLEEMVSRAESSNADLQRLLQEEKVEESRRLLFQAQRIPNLTAEFGADFNSPPDFQVGPKGQIGIEVPIFSRNQGEIAQSRANSRLLEGEFAALQRQVAGRVQGAYFSLAARQTQAETYRQRILPDARRLSTLSEESYREGKVSILTVLDARRKVQQLEREYLDTLFSVQSGFAQLEETVGVALD